MHTVKHTFFTKVMKQVNTDNVGKLCQDIMLMLFNMISTALLKKGDNSLSENDILNLLQKEKRYMLDIILLQNMGITFIDKDNRCYRAIILNALKYLFIDVLLIDSIK